MLGRIPPRPDGFAEPSRRGFLKATGTAGLGLVLGVRLPSGGGALAAASERGQPPLQPDAFMRIAPDHTVTVLIKHIEFGQGTWTGLATLVAEELDADWSQIRAEAAPADARLYNNLHWGPYQGTGGSSSIANAYLQMRTVGAAARAMLIAEAAERWGVPAGEIAIERGTVRHGGSGQEARFGDLAEAAARRPVPEDVTLKGPGDFRLIGGPVPRLDSRAKTRGEAVFTLDLKRPGMLTAVLTRPPRFGGKPARVDAAAALKVKGVVEVIETPRGVAVLAESTWPAIKGRDALAIDWDDSAAEKRSSADLMAEYRRIAEQPGLVARKDGDADAAMAAAARVIEADYEYPFLAHAPMEPLDCVIELSDGGCEIWTGSQLQTIDQYTAAEILGVVPEQVKINTMLTGGSFGRRATPDADQVAEACFIAKAIGGRAPLKVVWTREDDIRGGRYRPMYFHRLRAGLDGEGRIIAWQHRIVGQSILRGTPFEDALVRNGVDQTSVEGANNLPYAIPHLTVDVHNTDVGVPVLWWRAVGSTHTAYSAETFLDEIAAATGRDAVDLRRELLRDHPRHLGVLDLVAEKAGWGGPVAEGIVRGVAVHESFNSYVAQVADVRVGDDGKVRVERVVCAVDCGIAVNPDVIRAQMEGGIGFGLGAILHDEITLDQGRVEQSNFHDYVSLSVDEMPAVEVHIVPSAAAPTGVGEPGVPPIGPAVANAVFAATGKRIRTLPFARHNLLGA